MAPMRLKLLGVILLAAGCLADKYLWLTNCGDESYVYSTDLATGKSERLNFTAGTTAFCANSTDLFYSYSLGHGVFIGRASVDGSFNNPTWIADWGEWLAIDGDEVVYETRVNTPPTPALMRAYANGSSVRLNDYFFYENMAFQGLAIRKSTAFFGVQTRTFDTCPQGGVVTVNITDTDASDAAAFSCIFPYPLMVATVGTDRLAVTDGSIFAVFTLDARTGALLSNVSMPDRVYAIASTPDGASLFVNTRNNIFRLDSPFTTAVEVAVLPAANDCIGNSAGYVVEASATVLLISPSSGSSAGGFAVYAVLATAVSDEAAPVCRFGASSSGLGTVMAPQIVKCVAPETKPSVVAFWLTLSPSMTTNALNFTFV